MGSCFSSAAASTSSNDKPTAIVVDIADGSLIEYSEPVFVSEVLGLNQLSYCLCDSNSLCYGLRVTALGAHDLIGLGQLYFMLPAKKLHHQLSGSDMAALAVKASSALAVVNKSRPDRRARGASARVASVAEKEGSDEYMRFNEDSVGINASPSPCPKEKLQIKNDSCPDINKVHRRKLSAIEEVAE